MNTLITKIICCTLYIILAFKPSFSKDILLFSDLIPIESTESIIKFQIENYNSDNPLTILTKDKNSNELKLDTFNKSRVGFITGNDLKISADLSTYQLNRIQNHHPKKRNSQILGIDINLLNRPKTSSNFSKWRPYFGLTFNRMLSEKINCFEGINFVVGGSESNCKVSGKTFYDSNQNGKTQPALIISSNSIGLKTGVEKYNQSWDQKNTIRLGIKNVVSNFNIIKGKGFNSIDENLINEIPQNKPFTSNIITASYLNSRKVGNKWAIGSGVRLSHVFRRSFDSIKLNRDYKSNLIFDILLSRKSTQNSFLGFGMMHSTNYVNGIDDTIYNQASSKLFGNAYSQISLSYGWLLSGNPETKSIHESKIRLNLLYNTKKLKVIKTERKKIYNNKEKSLANINKKTGDNSFYKYALEFAFSYDEGLQKIEQLISIR